MEAPRRWLFIARIAFAGGLVEIGASIRVGTDGSADIPDADGGGIPWARSGGRGVTRRRGRRQRQPHGASRANENGASRQPRRLASAPETPVTKGAPQWCSD